MIFTKDDLVLVLPLALGYSPCFSLESSLVGVRSALELLLLARCPGSGYSPLPMVSLHPLTLPLRLQLPRHHTLPPAPPLPPRTEESLAPAAQWLFLL